ncbi:MAG: hypothetical protein U5K30_00620 [Acidimicrobiales bacterium]|nr:hypothetical protein [Acidimicrobiales bacterium]
MLERVSRRTASEASRAEKSGGTRTTHQTSAPVQVLWFHAAIGAVVLTLAMAFVGTSSFIFVDEAALVAQAEVHDRGDWVTSTPLPDVDVDASLVPMIRANVADGAYAPYAKHPSTWRSPRGCTILVA